MAFEHYEQEELSMANEYAERERQFEKRDKELRLACAKAIRKAYTQFDNELRKAADEYGFAVFTTMEDEWLTGLLMALEDFHAESVQQYAARMY